MNRLTSTFPARAVRASHTRRRGRQRLALSVLGAVALALASGVPVQAQTWSGQGFTGSWADLLNWQGGVRPLSAPTTAITFAGTRQTGTQQNLASPFVLNSMTFASGAGAFTVSGNALRFAGSSASLVQNTANPVTLAVPIQIVEQLVVSGSGSLTLKGGLASANADPAFRPRLVKRGSGRLTLTEPSSFAGLVHIEQGPLRLEHALALQAADVTLAVDNGLDLAGAASVTLGGLSGSGALALGATRLSVGGSHSTPAAYSGNLSASTGGLVKVGDGRTELRGTSTLASLQVERGSLLLSAGSMTLTDTAQGLLVGSLAAAPVGAVAELELNGGATLTATGHTAQVDGSTPTQLRVAGAGSQLNTGFQLLVGNHGRGTMTVSEGGRAVAGTFLVVGTSNGGHGSFEVLSGGTVFSPGGVVGLNAGSAGNARVSGPGSRWDNGQLGLGGFSAAQRGGNAMLSIEDGGVVTASGRLDIWSADSRVFVDRGQLRVGALASDGAVGTLHLLADPDAGAALVIEGAGGEARYAGVIEGAGSLHKSGGLVQTLAGANSFSGRTTIAGGRIVLGHAQALQNSTVVLDIDGGLDLAGLPAATVGGLAGNGSLALGATWLSIGQGGQSASYGGRLTGGSDGATGAVVKVGAGTSTFTGSGSSFNSLRVDDGTLRVEGGSLQLNSATRGGDMALLVHSRFEVLDGAVVSANAPGDSSVFVDGAAGTQLLVDGTGSRLDAGFQVIVGNAGHGELALRNGGALQGTFAVVAGAGDGSRGQLSVESGGRLSAPLVGLGMLAGAQGQALVSDSGSELRATAELGLGGATSAQNGGTGTLTLRNGGQAVAPRTVFWTEGSRVRIDGGQLQAGALVGAWAGSEIELLADPSHGQALVLDSSAGSHRFDGRISGAGGVLKRGAGTQRLMGGNSFTGAVRVEAGTLQMASSRAGEFEVHAGAQLQLGERNLGTAVVQALPGSTVVYTGASLAGGQLLGGGTHDVSAVQRIVGTQLGVGSTLRPADGATLVGVGNSGHVVNAAGHSLVWTGGGNTVGTFTVAGSTTVSGFSSAGMIQVQPGATLTNTGTDLLLAAGSRSFIGSAAAPGGLLRLADGSRVQLNGGLLVNNGGIDGALHVGYGGLAKGAGSFGAVTVGDGGRFSPGNSPGTARSDSATWGAGGGFVVELAAAAGTAGVHWDLWQIDGLLDITAGTSANSRFTLSVQTLAADGAAGPLAGFDPMQPWQWLIVDTGAGITGFDPGRLTLDLSGFGSFTAGGSFALALSDGDLFLQFAPVPEPGTWAQLLGGLAGLGWLAARRGRRA